MADISYDRERNLYTAPIFDMYQHYHNGDNIPLDELIHCASCGLRQHADYLVKDKEGNTKLDALKLVHESGDLMKLWKTNISPEPYMKKSSFREALEAYAEDTGVESTVDAYYAGVDVADLLA